MFNDIFYRILLKQTILINAFGFFANIFDFLQNNKFSSTIRLILILFVFFNDKKM